MNEYYKQAESLVAETIAELQLFLPKDGEDISYYNPCAVDTALNNVMQIKSLMVIATRFDNGE
jgi:hypothetical protein